MAPFIGSIVRHLLTLVAGSLIGAGVSEHDATNLTQAAEPVVGGLIIYLLSQGWSFFDKKKR